MKMNKKVSMILACAAIAGLGAGVMSCNESVNYNKCDGIEGQVVCQDNGILKCDENGVGQYTPCLDTEICTTSNDGVVCVDPNDVPDSKICQAGQFKCENNVAYSCVDGEWGNAKNCSTDNKVCNSKTGACDDKAAADECTNDDTKCEVKDDGSVVVSTCVDKAWTPSNEVCTACTSDGKKCADVTDECTNDDTKCEVKDDGSVVVSTCVDKAWTPSNEVCTACTSDGKKCADVTDECTNDDTKCEVKDDGSVVVSTCVDKAWTPSNEVCAACSNDGKKCAECTGDDTKCEVQDDGSVVVSTCVDKEWTPSNEVCVACTGDGKKCAECLESSECQVSDGCHTPTCDGGVCGETLIADCIACSSDDACTDELAYCGAKGTCVVGECDDEHVCADGKVCTEHACVPCDDTTNVCADNYVCLNGACMFKAAPGESCADAYTVCDGDLVLCDSSDNKCKTLVTTPGGACDGTSNAVCNDDLMCTSYENEHEEIVSACMTVKSNAGDDCGSDAFAVCGDGLKCGYDNKCKTPVALSGSCADTTNTICDEGLTCAPGNVCKIAKNVGATCDDTIWCGPYGQCEDNLCKVNGNGGSKCNDTDKLCISSLVCVNEKCVSPAAAGESCASIPCATNLKCDTDNTCKTVVTTVGDACGGTSNAICGDGLRCSSSNTCKQTYSLGGGCDDTTDCEDAYQCDEGLCKLPGNIGEVCNAMVACGPNGKCENGLCKIKNNQVECNDSDKLCISSLSCVNKKCVSPAAVGESCASIPCATGLVCDSPDNKCKTVVTTVGGACGGDSNAICDDSLACDSSDNKCKNVVTTVGGACGGDSNAICGDGLACDSSDNKCKTVVTTAGGACGGDSNAICDEGMECSTYVNNEGFLVQGCMTVASAVGADCGADILVLCSEGMTCGSNNKCRVTAQPGATCSDWSDCDGLYCDNGTCKTSVSMGQPCGGTVGCGPYGQCEDGICKVNGNGGSKCNNTDKLCISSLVCVDEKCIKPAAAGESCESKPCAKDLACDTDNKCKTVVTTPGGACGGDTNAVCDSSQHLFCNQGMCDYGIDDSGED